MPVSCTNSRCPLPSKNILEDARGYCREKGLRLTEGRMRILAAVVAAGKGVKAYDLLESVTEPEAKVMPPVVYRALDFWIEHGFIHRIESINAYMACGHPLHSHGCQMLICTDCGRVIEVCNVHTREYFKETARSHNFTFRNAVLEIYGQCADCRNGKT